jgi:Na+-driven multidrug efflux pump
MKIFAKYINTLFVVIAMTLFMGTSTIILNNGYEKEGWIDEFFKSWLVMLPIAYIFALIIIPVANKLTRYIYRE